MPELRDVRRGSCELHIWVDMVSACVRVSTISRTRSNKVAVCRDGLRGFAIEQSYTLQSYLSGLSMRTWGKYKGI